MTAIWATSLTPLTTRQNRTVADNLLRALPVTNDICPTNGSYTTEPPYDYVPVRPFMHEALLAALVANGLSQAAGATQAWLQDPPGSGPWTYDDYLGQEFTSVDTPGAVLVFHGQLPGYAWNRDGVPVRLAITILILYSLFVGAYVGYTFWTGWSSSAWSAVSDLVVLALVSEPPAKDVLEDTLEDVAPGRKRTGMFQKGVTVREADSGARLRLVFPMEGKGDGEG